MHPSTILRQSSDVQRVTVLAAARRPAEAIVGFESAIAPACAVALLVHPSPLTWPALLIGALPSLVRLATSGRPWRSTPFDLGLGLLAISVLAGLVATLDPAGSAIRLTGLAAALILFAWARERASTPHTAYVSAVGVLIVVLLGGIALLHLAAPFLRLDRVPPLAVLASLMEPIGLYRLLVADDAALQRYRLYASGVGALAAVGLAISGGLALASPDRRDRLLMAFAFLFFGALLYASDNRGSMVTAALTLGCLVVWWRPRLLVVAALVVFGTLDLIALGLAQRGFSLRTVAERVDFWHKGLLLARETPFTGVGLGVESVQEVYRAVFQPAFPPFTHAHNIFVQALLEQGILGLVSLVLISVALLRLGAVSAQAWDRRAQAASLAAFGGALALLTAGLTEIVALTTVGTVLLFGLLGLLVASHDAAPILSSPPSRPPSDPHALTRLSSPLVNASKRVVHAIRLVGTHISSRLPPAPGRRRLRAPIVVVLVLATLALTGWARPLAALPLLNAGTTALYRGTIAEGTSRAERARALAQAVPSLRLAVAVDPDGPVARRNLSLALTAGGDHDAARHVADDARVRTPADDFNGQFAVGRAYAAAGAYDVAIAIWTEIGAGPQLLRLGRQLSQGASWETGVEALASAAIVGAPVRPAADAITRAALAHGESTDAAIGRLSPLIEAGGMVEYFALLQVARLYRLDGRPELAEQVLMQAYVIERDEQFELERGLQLLWRERYAEAEQAITWVLEHPADPPKPVPDGDDPRYWLATVQLRQGRVAEAAANARAGLAALPAEQGSLRAPYHLLLGESLLAAGRPAEALETFQAGLRLAPGDARLADGIARARASRR